MARKSRLIDQMIEKAIEDRDRKAFEGLQAPPPPYPPHSIPPVPSAAHTPPLAVFSPPDKLSEVVSHGRTDDEGIKEGVEWVHEGGAAVDVANGLRREAMREVAEWLERLGKDRALVYSPDGYLKGLAKGAVGCAKSLREVMR